MFYYRNFRQTKTKNRGNRYLSYPTQFIILNGVSLLNSLRQNWKLRILSSFFGEQAHSKFKIFHKCQSYSFNWGKLLMPHYIYLYMIASCCNIMQIAILFILENIINMYLKNLYLVLRKSFLKISYRFTLKLFIGG